MRILKSFAALLAGIALLALLGVGGFLAVSYHYGRGLPDYQALATYEPPVVTRVHAADGSLIAEYATEKRVFVPIDAIPTLVKEAFLAAEDKNFYTHPASTFSASSAPRSRICRRSAKTGVRSAPRRSPSRSPRTSC